MPDVAGGLAWFLTQHVDLRADEAEGVDDDFDLRTLDGVNDNGDGLRFNCSNDCFVLIHTPESQQPNERCEW